MRAVCFPKARNNIVIYSPDDPVIEFIKKYINLYNREPLPAVAYISSIIDFVAANELFSFKNADIFITHEYIHNPSIKSVNIYSIPADIVCRKGHPRLN